LDEKIRRNSTDYYGVKWQHKRWVAQFMHEGTRYYIGGFENKEDAARAVNLQCRELKIALKNPSVQLSENETLETFKEQIRRNSTNPYHGISWQPKIQKWHARLKHNGIHYYVGVYTNKEDAAKAVNLQCRELKIDLKNPSVQISENETLETFKKQLTQSTSKYEELSWDEERKRWQVEFNFNGKKRKYYFDNEFEAIKSRNRIYKTMEILSKGMKFQMKQKQRTCIWYDEKNVNNVLHNITNIDLNDKNVVDDSEKSEISNLWLGNEIEFKEDKDEPITHDEKNFHNVSHKFTNIDFKDKNLISEKSEISKLWSDNKIEYKEEKDEPIIDTKKNDQPHKRKV